MASSLVVLAGGKGGNQALAAARAGATVHMAGAVGDDGMGDIALAGLHGAGVNTDAVAAIHGPTGTARSMSMATEKTPLSFFLERMLAPLTPSCLPAASKPMTCFTQMEIPVPEMAQMISHANRVAAKVVWNLAPMQAVDIELLRQVAILVVNEVELQQLGKHLGLPTDGTVAALLAQVAEQTTNSVVLTAKGCLADHQGDQIAVPALPIKPVDTVGAGDAFCGAFAAALDAGEPFPTALRWGCVAGSLACLKEGHKLRCPAEMTFHRICRRSLTNAQRHPLLPRSASTQGRRYDPASIRLIANPLNPEAVP